MVHIHGVGGFSWSGVSRLSAWSGAFCFSFCSVLFLYLFLFFFYVSALFTFGLSALHPLLVYIDSLNAAKFGMLFSMPSILISLFYHAAGHKQSCFLKLQFHQSHISFLVLLVH
jgi:hypothetical protein